MAKPRGARFTVLDEDTTTTGDYIILELTADRVEALYKELQLTRAFIDALRDKGSESSGLWCVHLCVKAHHQKYVGKTKPDGSPPDVSYPPSLLTDDIPQE